MNIADICLHGDGVTAYCSALSVICIMYDNADTLILIVLFLKEWWTWVGMLFTAGAASQCY